MSRLPFHLAAPGLLVALLCAGCQNPGGPASAASTGLPPTLTATAFVPEQATPTPDLVRLWIDPAVPSELQIVAAGIDTLAGLSVEMAAARGDSEVRLEAGGDVPLTQWVYALVAPFAQIEDSVDGAQLREWWSGAQPSPWPILVSAEDLAPVQALLGPASEAVVVVEADQILDQAWTARPALAIVPFDRLEPRWKVLQVGGRSPLDRGFDPKTYPLTLTLGASGEPAAAQALAQALTAGRVEAAAGWPATNRDESRLTRVVMTGVTALTRATAWRMESKGVTYPAGDIGDWLRTADITHISNEVAFAENCPPAEPGQDSLRFCSAPDNIGLLEDIGTDVVELTGNHVLDWGPAAFLGTLEMYQERGWPVFGGGRDLQASLQPVKLEHNGNRLAFLGCNQPGPGYAQAKDNAPGATPCYDPQVMEVVSELKSEGYLPIFTFQWAEANRSSPLPDQVAAFRQAIDAGAVIVSGSQAHQPQGFEFDRGSFIHYGLGNLFFDQMDRVENRELFIDRHVFYDGRHISTELLTGMLEDYSRPRPMTAAERTDFLRRLFAASGW